MPAPTALPPDLLLRPFTVAEAYARGLTPDVLRGARLRSPFRGVRVSRDLPDTLQLRCRAALLLLLPRDTVFSHATAAALRDLPLPRASDENQVHSTSALRAVRVGGLVAHLRRPLPPCVDLKGLPVTDATTTWVDLAASLALDDLVILGDAMLRRGWVDLRALGSGVDDARRGVRRARAALPLLEPRTDSPMETRLRLLIVRAGLPRPAANRDVIEDVGWIARPDLSYPQWRIAIEYEGDHHRTDRQQWKRDKSRRRVLEDHGWKVIEVIDDDVFRRPRATIARIRAAIAERTAT